jgi:Cysteine-rich CWC
MKGPVQKTCECCGQGFECVGYLCWCSKLGITQQQMDWIAERYDDCLCLACLRQVQNGAIIQPQQSEQGG